MAWKVTSDNPGKGKRQNEGTENVRSMEKIVWVMQLFLFSFSQTLSTHC